MKPAGTKQAEASPLQALIDLGALGRVFSLPTVISNCLAGWVLSGCGNIGKLILACLSLSFLQVAISWLTLLFDLKSESDYQRMYPWLSTRVTLRILWILSVVFIWLGILLAACCGRMVAILACWILFIGLLTACTHRLFFLSALLPGFLRASYYVVGGSVAWGGLMGESLWGAVGILFFMFGSGYVTRQRWNAELRSLAIPSVAFAVPLLLALIVNDGDYRWIGVCFTGAVFAWLLYIFYRQNVRKEMAQTAAYLTATICLIDFLAAGVESVPVALLLGVLFILANFFTQNMKRMDDIWIVL
ncbi:MAG: hypothetical protein ACOX2U_04000 [Limisphaerales bacterium]|jgi:4-hydroxybenzoate polyprenyltransferase